MLLRLEPEDLTKPIDFREGMWGHTLHAKTFAQEPRQLVVFLSTKRVIPFLPWPIKTVTKSELEPPTVRRYSFMVHTSDTPVEGREVIWKNADGLDRRGVIYEAIRAYDPKDMWTLKVVVDD